MVKCSTIIKVFFYFLRERSRSPRQLCLADEEGSGVLSTDELSLVGFLDDVEVSSVFDASGERILLMSLLFV